MISRAYLIDDYAKGKDIGIIDILLVGNIDQYHFSECDLPQPIFEEIQKGFKVTVFKTTQKITQKTRTRDQILTLLSKNPKMTRENLARVLAKSPIRLKGILQN